MAEIIVTVNKTGAVSVSVNGVAGPTCKDVSALIEKALGSTRKIELTSEYYEENESGTTEIQQ